MGTLYIYNTISAEHKTVRGKGKLTNILSDYDLSKCAVIKEGERIFASDYEVTDDDILYVRVCPTASAALAVTAIVVAVVAAGVGVGTGLYAYKLSKDAEKQAREAEKAAKKQSEDVTQYPFLKGANNTSALGNTIQYLMGNCYNTPYKLNDGFYSIGGTDGEKQYYNLILSAGWGQQLIQSLSIGSEKIKDFSDVSPQTTVTGFNATSLYYDENNIIEIAQTSEFQTAGFQQKVVGEYYGDEIKHEYGESAEDLIEQCSNHTMKVEVCIQFNGLRKFSNKNWTTKSVTVNPYWSNDGGATWNLFTFDRGNNVFTYNSNHTLRFTATKTFTYAQCYGKNITIKLVRETAKEETNSQESVYLLYVNSFCYDNKKSASGTLTPCKPIESPFMEKTTRIGLRIIANDNTSGLLDQINAISYGVARTWNKVLRVWSETKTTTRNIASWLLEIMESDTHTPSKITDNEIDLDSFGALYEYCDENEFYCDGIITQGIKKESLISKLLSLCFADMYIDSNGKYSIAIDHEETTPIALLNPQSVRTVTVAKSFERQPDGIKASFTNRESWLQDTMYAMLDGGEKGIDDICTETAIEYATEAEHIYKICQRRMRQQVLQPREITVKVGREGDYYPLYSKVFLQLEQLRQGIRSAVIHNVRKTDGKIIRLDISDLLDFGDNTQSDNYIDENGNFYCDENGDNYVSGTMPISATYGVLIQAQSEQGKRTISAQVYGFGKTRAIYFFNPLADDGGIMPQSGNILSFGLLNENGEFDRITNEMKITAVKPDSDGWSLTLKDYSDAIYEYGTIPTYKTNLTSPSSKALPATVIKGNSETIEKEEQQAETVEAIENAIIAGTTNLVLSRASIQFHKNGADNTLYAETITFTAALMQDNNGVAADTVTASSDSVAFSATASKNGLVITVNVTSSYGATFATGAITVAATCNGIAYTAKCTITAIDSGEYLNAISSVANLPANPSLGDYFTWTGDDTTSTLVTGGTFKKTYVYRYTDTHGSTQKWIEDNRVEHNANALSDILSMNTAQAADTNTYALTFLNRLVSNTIFVNELVANNAFIDSLFSTYIKATGSIRVGDRFDANGDIADNTKMGAWFGNSGVLKAHKAELTDIMATGGTIGGNLSISGVATAANFSLAGFEAGDILLKSLNDMDGSASTVKQYAQICGTGTIRLKFKYKSGSSGGRPDIFISKITSSGTAPVVASITETSVVNNWIDYSIDFAIAEGENVLIVSKWAGAIAPSTASIIKDIGIYTNGACGVLAYLGGISMSESFSPSR